MVTNKVKQVFAPSLTATAAGSAREGLAMSLTRTDNLSAHRFFGMGFALGRLRIFDGEQVTWHSARELSPGQAGLVQVDFRCVCGRVETFQSILEEPWVNHFNLFEQLHNIGSLSRRHLVEDGYTPSQIDNMEALLGAYMERAGFERHRMGHAFDSSKYGVPDRGSAWVYRAHRVPPVPGLDHDYAVRLLRGSDAWAQLPADFRSEPLKFFQGDRYQVPGLAGDPYVSDLSRPIRARAGLDPER